MRPETVESELTELVRARLDWEGDLPSGRLTEHFDSMQLMTLLVAVEDHFRIVLDPSDEESLETTQDILRVIEEKTNER